MFFVVFQEITSPFLLTGGIWSGIARSFKQNISEREWSVDRVLQSLLQLLPGLGVGCHWLAVGEPVVNVLTVRPAVRETFMTFGTLEGLLSAVKSLVFC